MTPPARELDETLTTIARQAKALREAGVTGRVSVGLISFELERAEPPPSPVVEATPVETEVELDNPLNDPATYGGTVPTRRQRDKPNDRKE